MPAIAGKCQKIEETRKASLFELLERQGPANILILDLEPPELGKKKFLLF